MRNLFQFRDLKAETEGATPEDEDAQRRKYGDAQQALMAAMLRAMLGVGRNDVTSNEDPGVNMLKRALVDAQVFPFDPQALELLLDEAKGNTRGAEVAQALRLHMMSEASQIALVGCLVEGMNRQSMLQVVEVVLARLPATEKHRLLNAQLERL